MVRYLSPGWFARLEELRRHEPGATVERADALVLRHEVAGSPDGDVAYDVVLRAGGPSIDRRAEGPADVTFRTDYATAAAIAAGRQSVNAAMADGRLRVSGNIGALTGRGGELAGADPVPASLRDETDY